MLTANLKYFMMFLRYLLRFLFWALIVLVFVGTLLPLIPSSQWYVRIWDYPRLQAFFLAVMAMLSFYFFYYKKRKRGVVLMLALSAVVVYQAAKAFPYTPFASKQVFESEREVQDSTFISLLVSNVLQYNTEHEHLMALIDQYNPDLIVTLESDIVWQNALAPISATYPYTVMVPLDNTYGMHLFSRLPLKEEEIMYLLEPDVPSIKAKVQLRSGAWLQLFVVHPRPPVPGESNDSRERDAEIVMIGKMAKAAGGGVIVAGDFNDVAWSPTSKLFQEVSGLLDPRIGRGYYSTFHAQYPLFRWPLDHVFHSSHFKLVHMERLPDIRSDHFPMFIKLSYEPAEEAEQPKPESDEDTAKEADRIIQKGVQDDDAPGN